jgi:hypothetical protein
VSRSTALAEWRDTKMFGHLGDEHVQLEPIEAIETAAATHLRFRIAK